MLDADGSNVLADIYNIFGTTQQTFNIPINESGTDVIGAFRNAIREATRAARSFIPTGWRVLCGKNFFDKLAAHSDLRDIYKRDISAAQNFLNEAVNFRMSFMPGVEIMEYWGTVGNKADGTEIVHLGDDEAIMFPIVPNGFEMYELLAAPPKTLNYVNTRANQTIYAWEKMLCERSETDPEGIKFMAEMNVLPIVKHPDAIVRLTAACGAAGTPCP